MSRSHEPPYLDPPPALSRAERNVMVQEAYEAYEQLFKAIRIARSGNDAHATALGGVSGKTTGTVMMCTTTTITGTLEEVAELYTARDSHYVLDFAESKRLYELESPSKESPMRCVGLRYSRWASISSLVTDRDLVYLEVMDEFVDKKTGHRGWARCTKSIEHRACPPSQHPNGPLRAELFVMGLVVRETATFGVLELITLVHADVRKRIPSWITRTVLKARKKNAQMLSHVLKVKRRVRDGGSAGSGGGGSQIGDFTGRSHASSEEEAKDPRVCKGCMDRVSRWTRSYKCRKCHELICKSCATMTYLDTDTRQLRNRICAECSFADEDQSDDDSVDFELIDAHDYTAGSQRQTKERARAATRDESDSSRGKDSERRRRKHKKHSEDGAEHRERTYSQLSVEEKTFPSSATLSPTDPSMNEDLGSTMTRLKQLNASHHKPRPETPPLVPKSPNPEPPTLHHHHSAGKRTAEPPTLHRQQSNGSVTSRGTRNSRGLERKPSQENVHVEPSNRSNSRQRPGSSNSRSAARKMSSPVIRADPTPPAPPPAPAMLDLSYLQSFAVAKPAGPKPTPAHEVSV